MAHGTDDNGEVPTRSWSDLPTDLLQPIANRLGLIQLLSFRSVCKDWQSASTAASAHIESKPYCKPWLLIFPKENSVCVLYNESKKKKYTISIPELTGATCLASDQGWLLVFRKGIVFFFCPFSGVKIDLPKFPHSELAGHVAAFSAPPTSEDCVVSIINKREPFSFVLNVLARGDTTWTKCEFYFFRNFHFTCAIYHDGMFCYLGEQYDFMAFSFKEKFLKSYWFVPRGGNPDSKDVTYLPIRISRNFGGDEMEKLLGSDHSNVSISICGTVMPGKAVYFVIHNENIKTSSQELESRNLNGVWIHPRFHQITQNQSWSL